MTKPSSNIEKVIKAWSDVFLHFPLAVLSSWGFLFVIICDIHKIELGFDTAPVLYSLALGVLVFTVIRVFTKNRLFCLVGIMIVIAYFFELHHGNGFKEFIRFFLTSLALFIMIVWGKNLSNNISNTQFWESSKSIASNFLLSIVFTLSVIFGFMTSLKAMELLFGFEIEDKIYGDIFFSSIVFVGVNYFLYHLIDESKSSENKFLSKANLIFTKYILTPITIFYLLILYSYTFKILIDGVLPKGVLAWIVIGFTAIGVLTYLSWTPYWHEKNKKFKKIFILAIFLQTLMLGLAIYTRIAEYGWTVSRYLVVAYGVWLFGICLYFLIKDDAKYKWIFISFSAILLISQYGAFSAYTVSYKDQLSRLTTLLQDNKNLSEKTPIKIRYEISDKINYISKNFGINSLKSTIPNIVDSFLSEHKLSNTNRLSYNIFYDFPLYATKKLGFKYVSFWQYKDATQNDKSTNRVFKSIFLDYEQNKVINIKDFDWEVELTSAKDTTIEDINTSFYLSYKTLLIKENKAKFKQIDLSKFFKNLIKNASGRYSIRMSQKQMSFNYKDKEVSIMIIFNNIDEKDQKIIHAGGTIYYKRFK